MVGDRLVVRPDPRKVLARYRRQLPAAVVAVAALLIWSYLRLNDIGWDGLLVMLLAVGLGGEYLLIRWNATLFVDEASFGETSLLRRKRSIALSELRGVERVGIRRANQGARSQFLVLRGNGAVAMQIADAVWSDADLERLWQRLGVTPTGSFTRVLTYREYKRAYGDR
jgi:hypothetical protein